MPGFLHIMRCVGRAVVKNGAGALANLVPFGNALFEIAKDALEEYRKGASNSEAALRAELQAVAQASPAEVRQVAEEVASSEARGLPEQVRQTLVSTLSRMQDSTRRSLRRPDDPSGKTVPSSLSLKSPADLLQFLPARPPRFKPGDRPLPGVGWELEKLLGVGGFGEVWKARNARLTNITAALKFCLDPEAGAALLNEGANLNHVLKAGHQAGIVQLKNAYLETEPYCLEYEFIEGDDLAGAIHKSQAARGPLPPETATRIIHRLARTVGHVHRLSPPLVHRDLKPANVLVQSREGKSEFLITDFGIGGVAASQALEQTRQGISGTPMLTSLQGAHTPLYASPEQKRGEPPDPRDDVHALGVIWYQLLVGDMSQAPPFDWIAELQGLKVDGGIIDVLGRCIAGKAERRPADAAALAEQIHALFSRVVPETRASGNSSQFDRDVKESLEQWRTKGSPRPYFERQGPQRVAAWQTAAEEGDAAAQWLVARCLQEGLGVEKNPEAAVAWLRRAAGSGLAVAQNDLGAAYYWGVGVEQDSHEAFRLFTAAAEQGFAEAQANRGDCYYYGEGVAEDCVAAAACYRKAADQGWARGQDGLGDCFFDGSGVDQDYPQAIGWYRKAAEQGLANAQGNLGYCYANGKGLKKDPVEAVKWYRKAAEGGVDWAQFNLGYCYQYEFGVEQDLHQAEQWYRKAADQGYKKAKNALKRLAEATAPPPENAVDAAKSSDEEKTFIPGPHHIAALQAIGPEGADKPSLKGHKDSTLIDLKHSGHIIKEDGRFKLTDVGRAAIGLAPLQGLSSTDTAEPVGTPPSDVASERGGEDRIIERLRAVAPDRGWAEGYLELARRLLEITRLGNDDPRLVLALPQGALLPITINRRYVLSAQGIVEGQPGHAILGLTLSASLKDRIKALPEVAGFEVFKPGHAGETTANAPLFVRFTVAAPFDFAPDVLEDWKRAALAECGHGESSSFRRFHEPTLYRVVTDLLYRQGLLDRAFPSIG